MNNLVKKQRSADLTVKSNWALLNAHVMIIGRREVKLWHVLITGAFFIGLSTGLFTLSDRISSRTQAVALPSSIENTAQLAFKNAAGVPQPTVTSQRVVTNVQGDAPACTPGGPCRVNNCPGTFVCQNNQQVCQDVPGDGCPTAPASCTPGGNCTVNNCPGRFACQSNGQKVCQDVAGDNCPRISDGGGSRVVLSIEAESARLSGTMVVKNDVKASGGKYIIYNRQRPKDPHAQADITFNVPKTGDYTFWGMTLAPDGLTDSFAVKVDGKPAEPYLWYTRPLASVWRFRQVTKRDGASDLVLTLRLIAGSHTLSFIGREETGLDKVVITNDRSYRP